MQDKITIADAPDCLNTNDKAMWVLGYEAAIEARGQCLHQIHEPAAAEQAAWHAGLDEGRAQVAPAAVAVPDGWKLVPVDPTEQMEQAAADYIGECVKAWGLWKAMIACAPECAALAATPAAAPVDKSPELQGSVVDKTVNLQDAAAAPVVLPEPDAVISELMGLVDEWGMESHLRGEAELDAQHSEATQEEIDCAKDRASKERAAWKAIESKLRALLATATGLPAQVVLDLNALPMPKNPHHPGTAPGEHAAWACGAGAVFGAVQDAIGATPAGQYLEKLKSLSVTNILLDVVPGYDGMGHEVYATSVDEVVEKLSDLGSRLEDYQLGITAAPQAQADARDAEQEVLMEHSGCGSNTQVDMLTVRLNPGDKVVMHKGRITQGFERANRAAIAAAKGE